MKKNLSIVLLGFIAGMLGALVIFNLPDLMAHNEDVLDHKLNHIQNDLETKIKKLQNKINNLQDEVNRVEGRLHSNLVARFRFSKERSFDDSIYNNKVEEKNFSYNNSGALFNGVDRYLKVDNRKHLNFGKGPFTIIIEWGSIDLNKDQYVIWKGPTKNFPETKGWTFHGEPNRASSISYFSFMLGDGSKYAKIKMGHRGEVTGITGISRNSQGHIYRIRGNRRDDKYSKERYMNFDVFERNTSNPLYHVTQTDKFSEDINSDTDMYIGASPEGGYLDATILGVYIYNIDLSEEEIKHGCIR